MWRFVRELQRALGRPALSRQAVYNWESGRSQMPVSALLAAASLAGLTVDQLLERGRSFAPADRRMRASGASTQSVDICLTTADQVHFHRADVRL